jgi:diacylglycerol kinase (ATP)
VTSDEIAVLANPSAGRGRHRDLLPLVMRRLGADGRRVRLLEAASGAEAEEASRAAVADGVAALVAVGGDGTVHHALQAVAGSEVPFGVVPAGTGNDFAAGTAVPGDVTEAAEAIAVALRDKRDHRIDLARIDRAGAPARWFGAVLAAGFDAVVNERANRMRWPRGPRRYDLAIVLEMARLRPWVYELTLDGADHGFEGTLVAVGNCASYGGGMRIVPDADLADGLLDLFIVARMSRVRFLRMFPKVFRGEHTGLPEVTILPVSGVRIEADDIVAYADGERIGPLPIEVAVAPGALRILA